MLDILLLSRYNTHERVAGAHVFAIPWQNWDLIRDTPLTILINRDIMAIQHIKNVRIAGISAAVPRNVRETATCPAFENPEDAAKFIENVGVERVRAFKDNEITCADLCQKAAEALFGREGLEKEDIDLLVFVSQSQDYILPATACVLHGKFGLSQRCCAFDISLGCSGWVYGISVVAAMMESGAFKKCLLLAGDAGKAQNIKPLFGDAGTATILTYDTFAPEMIIDTQTDGTGYEAIIQRVGGVRYPFDEHSLEIVADKWGNRHRPIDLEMDGESVFVFGITKVPKAIKGMLKLTGKSVEDVDYFLFHQANMMMNEQIRRKCKIPAEKCPYSLRDFGNNSSASIPLTMVTQIAADLQARDTDIIACGFGVGLSWATMHARLEKPFIAPLVEI